MAAKPTGKHDRLFYGDGIHAYFYVQYLEWHYTTTSTYRVIVLIQASHLINFREL
jgi:hypothetical protein